MSAQVFLTQAEALELAFPDAAVERETAYLSDEDRATASELAGKGNPVEAGGTGQAFDWSVARACQQTRPVILAGGIDAGNLSAAIAEVDPFAVDVSSGVEAAPGVKDGERIRQLFKEARAGSKE